MKEIVPYVKGLGLPLIMTEHDRHAVLCRNPLRHKIIDAWEKDAAGYADILVTVAPSEHEYFQKAGIKSILAPSTTDIIGLKKRFMNMKQTAKAILREAGLNFESFMLFVGSSNDPNKDAKERIKELALQTGYKGLGWHFVIAGNCGYPHESTNNVHILGQVSEELLCALYARCSIVVSPLSGGTGASVKTVEAMGIGRIVFGSTATFRGLRVTDGEECFIEDNLDNYLPRLEILLNHDSINLLQTVSKKAEKFAAVYDYRTCLKPYVDFLESWPCVE
jgi:glycosyltransferase involved in cell wall biosynthesis